MCHAPPPEAKPLPEVRVETARARPLREETPIAGVLSALPGRDVKIGALVAGRVDRVFVNEGDRVTAGQVLARIETGQLTDRRREAEATREQTQAALQNAKQRVARAEKLWKDGVASRQEFDDAQAEVVAATSALTRAEATRQTSSTVLDRATLRAPFAGLIAHILVNAGEAVDGNGTPVLRVIDASLLDLRVALSRALAAGVRVGQRARFDDGDGVVSAVLPLVDTASNTVTVRIGVDNADGHLRAGAFVRGVLLGDERSALAVPEAAVLPDARVAVLDAKSRVTLREVELGAAAEGFVEIKAGVSDGERVVSEGGYSLPEGTEVRVVTP